jgi:hypothetical protein
VKVVVIVKLPSSVGFRRAYGGATRADKISPLGFTPRFIGLRQRLTLRRKAPPRLIAGKLSRSAILLLVTALAR